MSYLNKIKAILTLILITSTFILNAQKKTTYQNKPKAFTCTTFVYNLSLDEMKIKDICFDVFKGEYIDLNQFSNTKKKENELWRFDISIKDNQTQSTNSYKGSFYLYENYSEDIEQYHPVNENSQFKAVIYDKKKDKWQILLNQNDEYKILSSYSGYSYTNAFGIKTKTKSSISY